MRATVFLDDVLVAEAQELTELTEYSAFLHEASLVLVARETSRRLAVLGGTQPDLEVPPRRRPQPG